MKPTRLFNLSYITATLLTSVVPTTYASISSFNLIPYGGIDFGMQHVSFKKDYGNNLFKNYLPKANLFAGCKLNDYFSLEIGYESTTDKTNTNTFRKYMPFGGSDIFFNYLAPNQAIDITSRMKISGWNIGVLGEYKLDEYTEKNNFSLLGYIGIKNTKTRLSSILYTPIAHLRHLNLKTGFNNNNKKTLLKLAMGFQYLLHENFSIRVLGTFENTAKLEPNTDLMFDPHVWNIRNKFKKSISYSIGIVFTK